MDKKDNVKFWTFLAISILAVAILVLLIDFGIKTAILEESNKLKRLLWETENGQGNQGTTESGNSSNGHIDAPLPSDLLAGNNARMETGNVQDGDHATATRQKGNRRKNARMDDAGNQEVPPGN